MAVKKNKIAIKDQPKHLLGIQNLSIAEAKGILEEAKTFIKLNRSASKKLELLRGKTQINLFFEPSTRTQSSFDLAGKRLGADVMTMNVANSAVKKGETLKIGTKSFIIKKVITTDSSKSVSFSGFMPKIYISEV